jgi:hypothetical protein
MEHRFISKNFICENCDHRFKKLVGYNENTTTCDRCIYGRSHALEDSEFNRENLDRTYRLSFANGESGTAGEYHPVTDIFNKEPENIYGDARRRNHPRREFRTQRQASEQTGRTGTTPTTTSQEPTGQQQQQPRYQRGQERYSRSQPAQESYSTYMEPRQNRRYPSNLNLFFIPFTVSPFHGSVNRHSNLNNINGSQLFSDLFTIPSNDFFMDNFASNFASNFIDPFQRIVFIQSMQNQQPQGTPPASKEVIKNLKRFKMSEEYCKKDEKNKLEYPTCSVCLTELSKGEETVLISCGHLFHDPCIVKWLEMHNTCPVCRYEIPTEDFDYERKRQQRNNINGNYANPSAMNGSS